MSDLHLRQENERLRAQVRELEARVWEPEDTIRAIREGEVDAVVVTRSGDERVYSLRTADVLYRAMVEEMNEGALALDTSGLILYANPHFARMMSVEPATMVGRSIDSLIADESRLSFDQLRSKSTNGNHSDLMLEAGDGELIPVVASMNLIRLDDSDVLGMIVTDLRDQRQRQELIAESSRKDEFLAMLAHELRNPLAPIRNALALLGSPEASKESSDWARQVIDRQVSQLVRLLDDLLDVQRFTHGVIELRTESTELGALVESAIDVIRHTASTKRQKLRVERAAAPLPVLADSARLTQVISNLLVNAVKYSPAESEIVVSWRQQGSRAIVTVADNGIGMSPELLKRVFEPFVQGDRDLSRSQGGLGLGLTLVKRLVELHGGSVSGTSAGPGRGSEFTVTLPIHAEPQARAAASRAPPARKFGEPRRVLVVDDNEDSAVSLCALLRHAGHVSAMARDGFEALDVASSFKPEVIILDIGLPGMDGYELATRFRESMAHCSLVALTGYGRVEDRERAAAAGFDSHVIKPVEFDALLKIIAKPTASQTGER
jgi:PAS domain S-box-containing protein